MFFLMTIWKMCTRRNDKAFREKVCPDAKVLLEEKSVLDDHLEDADASKCGSVLE
ncbi:hypothetical protein HanIR_Chr15g0763311 [Helianthus annuus]|nr:hypothetical protein HanIR_Chr15g0763311 [Helianthus annuus]